MPRLELAGLLRRYRWLFAIDALFAHCRRWGWPADMCAPVAKPVPAHTQSFRGVTFHHIQSNLFSA